MTRQIDQEVDRVVELVLVALTYSVALYEVHKRVRVPVTPLLLLGGLATGLISESHQFDHFFAVWKELDYKTVELVFLPGLIFGIAISMDWYLLQRYFTLVTLLATACVLATWALTSPLISTLYEDWDTRHCFLLGAVLTATDHVAAARELQARHAERRFGVILQGETLLSQALVIVLLQETLNNRHVDDYVWRFVLLLFGGIVLGLAAGIVMHQIVKRVINDAVQETTLLLISTYAIYYASGKLYCSGATSVAVFGVHMAAYRKTTISASVEQDVRLLWQFLTQVLEAQVLFVSGVIVGIKVRDGELEIADVWRMVCLFLYTIVVRVAVVFSLYPVMKRIQLAYGWKESLVLACTGAKGVLSIVFSLVLYDSKEIPEQQGAQIIFQTVCVCICSTSLSHYAARSVVQLLGLSNYSKPEALSIAHSVYEMFEELDQEIVQLQHSQKYSEVNWSALTRILTPNIVLPDLVRQPTTHIGPRPRNNTEQELLSIVQAASPVETNADLTLLRRKFILLYRSMYWKECEQGQCYPTSATQLQSAATRSLELVNEPLAEWEYLQELLYSRLSRLVLYCGNGLCHCLFTSFARSQLQSMFDVASTFLSVQKKACEAFQHESHTSKVIEESSTQQLICEIFLKDHFLNLARETLAQIQSKKVIFVLYAALRRKILNAHEQGRIGDQYLWKLLKAADGHKKALETG